MLSNSNFSQPTNNPTPQVSVIIPAYNQAHFLVQAIESVLAQTYKNYEIIVINDGSTDHTAEVVQAFGDKIRYVYQENTGLPGARNTGLRMAGGELVTLLDSDDLYNPDYLSELTALLKANPQAGAVYCRAQFMDEKGQLLPQLTGSPVPPDQLYNQLLKANFLTPNCVMAYKYCYEQVGFFDLAIPRGEGDMWLQFAEKFTMVGTNKILARYRVVTGSMSSANPIPPMESAQIILRKRLGQPTADAGQWPPLGRDAYARTHFTAAIEFLQTDKVEEAYQQFRQAVTISPELLLARDVYYELGCGNQPRGYRGYFPALDINYNAKILFNLLDRLFDDAQISQAVKMRKRQAYINANLVLGKLSYGAGHLKDCQHFFGRAIAADPGLLFDSEVAPTLLKSLVKAWLLKPLTPANKR